MAANPQEEICQDAVVVIDNGSGMCKAGLSTENAPRMVFPEVIGLARKSWQSKLDKEVYVGDEVEPVRSKVSSIYPIEQGIISDCEMMELVWEYAFDTLQVDSQAHPVILTEPPFNPKANQRLMAEVMFETFGVPSLNLSIQGVLALYGQGRTTGLVLDSGAGVTHAIPIFQGFCSPHCVNRLDFAGEDLNIVLAKLLAKQGVSLTTSDDKYHAQLMKESLCYCALDPSLERADTAAYTLPDGYKVQMSDERWRCPEALFNHSMVGLESVGVGGLVWDSISKCEIDLRKDMLSNVVLSGGSTMFPGFAKRLSNELKLCAPASASSHVRIINSERQDLAVWNGGKVFADLRCIDTSPWMTREEYYEYGADLIHDKISLKYK